MDSRFDDLLHTVITEKGQGIFGFFDVVFGFMYRRTDFFYEMAPGENMGFFPGQAEAIVYNYMKKYQNIHYKERVPKRNIDPKEIEDFMKKQKDLKEGKSTQSSQSSIVKEEPKTELKQEEPKKSDLTTNIDKVKLENETEVKLQKVSEQTITKTGNTTTISPKFASISTYNGDICDNYNWSQGVMDVTIQVKLPEGTTKKMVIFK
jgi:hypothetical protein